jgi:SpoVK/Ycf46/Vps4 family AAA+-type ATPase
MKALNGMFLIDDFGRQKVSPTELLNRWIVPLESRIDFLMLNSGVSFQIPFDELVVFSTNLEPADLMDPAFLRRIPYKIELFGPDEAAFKDIFLAAARRNGLALDDDAFAYILGRLVGAKHDLAYFQPNFLCLQIAQICACFNLPMVITRDLADEALENLYIDLRK